MGQRINMWMKLLNNSDQELEEGLERSKCVQRDIEDQIEEEYKANGKVYQRTQIINFNNMSTTERPRIVVQDVLELLKKGYTRYSKDDLGNGSIQSHYNLTGVQVKELFMHTKLKNKKTILPKVSLIVIDEDGGGDVQVLSDAVATPNFDAEVLNGEIVVEKVNREELFS